MASVPRLDNVAVCLCNGSGSYIWGTDQSPLQLDMGILAQLRHRVPWISTRLTCTPSVPGGVLAIALVAISLPVNFPYHDSQLPRESLSLRRIDFLGALLLLAAMTLHITGFQQAANLYEWTSAGVLAPLLVSAFFWATFLTSQWYVAKPQRQLDPVFPWRFCQNRLVMGIIV